MVKLHKVFQSRNYLLFLFIIAFAAIISISLTSKKEILQFDAGSYYALARGIAFQKIDVIKLFFKSNFIDLGYPYFLSLLILLFGENIVIFQLFNYLFWFLATYFIYSALKLVTSGKQAFSGSLIMACSPVFLTFSAKLYSEPFASMGLAIIVYLLIKYKLGKSYLNLWGFLLGCFILFFTKSVYAFLFIPFFCLSLTRKNIYEYLILVFGGCLIVTRLYFSIAGGRSNYNLAIQSSKVHQTYPVIGVCSVYYLSYPIGKYFFPIFEGSCRQNDAQPYMQGYLNNPYVMANNIYVNFNLYKWLETILSNPIKYLFVMLSSMTSIFFVEGVYANVSGYFNSFTAVIIFAVIKIAFAFYIWSNVARNLKSFHKYGLFTALSSVIPLLYFFLIVCNYPVEQRYFFPLMPWVYFYAALDKKSILKIREIFTNKENKLI